MKTRFPVLFFAAVTTAGLAACGSSPATPLAGDTATDTVVVTPQTTELSALADTATAKIPPTLRPTKTVPPSRTFTPSPDLSDPDCRRATFVADITVPDEWETAPGFAFTKTWRMKNTGICTWDSTYALVFDHGERMQAPDSQPLAEYPVAPGEMVNISVDLVAPDAEGSYQAFFKLRAPDGSTFGIGANADTAFWVKIVVKAGAEPASSLPAVRIVSNRILVEGGTVGQAAVTCPGGTVVTGGGYTAGNFGAATFYPVYSQPSGANGWTASALSRGLGLDEITVYAVCLELPYAETALVEDSVTVPARKSASATVDCPDGSVVTGGGYSGNTDLRMYIKNNYRFGKGWMVTANNLGDYVTKITVYAVCLKGPGGKAISVAGDVEIKQNGTGFAEAACGAGTVLVGGGWSFTSKDMLAPSSYPLNGKWHVSGVNFTGSPKTLQARGVCLSLS
jgi:hypothetical protein